MQASSPLSSSISTPALDPRTTSSTHNAALTIEPAALLGAGSASLYPPQASVPGSSTSVPTTTSGTNGIGSVSIGSSSKNTLDSSAALPIAVKQEPEDENASPLAASNNVASRTEDVGDARLGSRLSSTSVATYRNDNTTSRSSEQPDKDYRSESRLKDEPASLVDKLLQSDHKAILRPDLSPFTDARDVLRRLLPYHVWNIPHHDLLKALDLDEDPVLSQVRSRKRRRIAQLHTNKPASVGTEHGQPIEASTDLSQSIDKPSADEHQGHAPHTTQTGCDAADTEDKENSDLSELSLPVPLPEVPQPPFPDLDFAESAFARRDSLASRFRRTLTALETTHKRAPSTALSLEHLERLAYSDDREEVLAQIEHLKALKLELETLEDNRQINAAESSARVNLRFGITDEIERERERERELERVKRQQERAAAKAAKLEKEREARHRIGIFTPPPETISTPAPPSPTSTSAATPAPSTLPTGVPPAGLSAAASLAMPSPYSGLSTPASTPGTYPFPANANLPYAPNMSMPAPGPNASAPSAHFGPPMMYGSVPGTQLSSAPSFASTSAAVGANGVPMPPGMAPAGASTFGPSASMPGTPSTPAATPSKPPSKSKAKAAAAAAAAASAPGTPGTPGTPGVTPGPTPHRGRGRPRKHPLPGTPGGPPIPVPRKKKEKPVRPPAAAAGSTPGTPSAQGAGAMSPPSMPPAAAAPGLQTRPPPSPSPGPTMPGPAPGYTGEMFSSTLPPTPGAVRPPAGSPLGNAASPMSVRPPTMHPTLTSATSLNTPRATPPAKPSPSPGSAPARPAAAPKKTPAKANGTTPKPASPAPVTSAPASQAAQAPAPAASNANPSIPNHPIPLLIPVASLPRLSALGIQPVPSPHIRPVIGPNGQPEGLEGAPIAIDPAQSVPAVLLGISEGSAEATAEGGGKQQILHISVVLSRLSPSQLSGLAVLMQSLQAQVEAGKRK
ncbi:GLTSCR1 domain-containing protein [Pseudozyma hubeiensis]|nr:GLTSCR1 domain-containing protein [Pseudozyma hubeiensis]